MTCRAGSLMDVTEMLPWDTPPDWEAGAGGVGGAPSRWAREGGQVGGGAERPP
jgi:hypothetical protein